jgi:hypothetical protein
LTRKEKLAHLLPKGLPKLGKKKRKEEEKRKHTNNPTSVA